MDSFGRDERHVSGLRRMVIVADNSLVVEAIRVGLRKSGEFRLVGHADGRRTSGTTIVSVAPDVVLLDDMDQSERAIQLIDEIKAEDDHVAIIVLGMQMDPDWLGRVFDAGAQGVISKSIHAAALPTLIRETLNGRIFHRFTPHRFAHDAVTPPGDTEGLPLTSRELDVLRLVAAGGTNGEVARTLWVTEQTVKFHLRNIYRKLDVANRTEASHFAHVNGLVDPKAIPSTQAGAAHNAETDSRQHLTRAS
jgi:DNA-binding NarL/FixJ family response regulator